MATMPLREQNARRFLGIAATLGVLGVAFNLNSDDSTLPKIIAAAGVVALIWSIHRFGRLGPDEPIVFEAPDEPVKKKKKKKKRPATDAADAPPADESSSNDGM
jgi:hypothetical protein